MTRKNFENVYNIGMNQSILTGASPLMVALLFSLCLSRCAFVEKRFSDERAPAEGSALAAGTIQVPPSEMDRIAYELGFNPRGGLSEGEIERVKGRYLAKRLEKQIDSPKLRDQYSRVLPWLASDSEKIEFLNIPSLEGRQAWINQKSIWNRANRLNGEMKNLVEGQDIAIGMPQDLVRKSWGEPVAIDVSGNPVYKNERWKYLKQISTPQGYRQENRIVYFEGGRVVGWDTE